MTLPFAENPLGGLLGATTCSVYRLDPTGMVPIEPVPDLAPGVFSPFRVTFDVVDRVQLSSECDVSQHPVQDFFDVVSHVHQRLKTLSVVGTLNGTPKLLFEGLPNPGGLVRLDRQRVRTLEAMQRARALLMVVTPDHTLSRCVIGSFTPGRGSEDGEATMVSMTFVEVRLVSPLLGAQVAQDYPSQAPGANSKSGGGQVQTTTVEAGATADPTPGVSPSFPSAIGPPA